MENRIGPNSTRSPDSQSDVALGQVVGFRIMRETEIAPSWWAQPTEIGETGSPIVADRYCAEQNRLTMDPNRAKRQRYFADPILASDEATPIDMAAPDGEAISVTDPSDVALGQVGRRLPEDWYTTAARAAHNIHCVDCRERTAASDAAAAENAASMGRRDRRQLGLNIVSTKAVNV
ncbi:hypothetical protein P1P75_35765 [Streptomyces sp. ID05-39B]|uniref:hypothetical protein n=1 Tax=Streptomyces sp. ID05-39B TaxID=3028664 RepID=UPI0029A2ACB6|nr:hypothetical protein [Streptomyces sp. ID05-39B]MDX3531611.1 hypothetical protein [Streptomyces sp. ID05-39B]